VGALGALPACNAIFGRDVHLGDGGPDGPGAGSDGPVVPEVCATPLAACSSLSVPVVGDWDGNGSDTPGLFDQGRWCYTNARAAGDVCQATVWGAARDLPVVGDWDGDGVDTPGVFLQGDWSLADAEPGDASADFAWGTINTLPLAGDWEARGRDTPGTTSNVGSGITWELSNRNSSGGVDHEFKWGSNGTIRLVGDWDGNGTDTPATYDEGVWSFSNLNAIGGIAATFAWGEPGDVPIVGDWDGDGFDTVGLYRDGEWLLTDQRIDALNGSTKEPVYTRFRWGAE
jgi:hypothetical protein